VQTSAAVREYAFPVVVSLLILLVTTIPYLYGYFSAPADKQFMGIMLDVPDHGQYFSWMHDLASQNLVSNKLTPEPNKAIFFNLLWWGLGRIGLLTGLGYAAMYQFLRLGSGFLFLLLAYRVCSWFLDDRRSRRLAFLVIALTSGFGWVLVVLKYTLLKGTLVFPLDLYVAEGNTFLGILGYPHFIAAALYIFVFDLLLRGEKRGSLKYAVAAGLAALFFGWQHAYDLVLVYGILAAYIGMKTLRDRRLPAYMVKAAIITGLISVWPALYSFLLTSLDPIWKQVLAQFANAGVFTPNPLHLPILLGITFLLALYTVIRMNPLRLTRLDDRRLFLVAWFIANGLLIYIPTDFQIHMLNGWQVPIAILAVIGLFEYIFPWAAGLSSRIQAFASNPEKLRGVLSALLIAVILPTNLYLFAWRFIDLKRHDYPYYLYKEEVQAFNWLDQEASDDQVILSSITTGQYIPMFTGSHAFLAHWAQTLDFYNKDRMVSEFFSGFTSDARRADILKQYGVSYVFYGPAERELGPYDPSASPLLEQVYSTPQVSVFAVSP
jgi:hypothetical protein